MVRAMRTTMVMLVNSRWGSADAGAGEDKLGDSVEASSEPEADITFGSIEPQEQVRGTLLLFLCNTLIIASYTIHATSSIDLFYVM